MTAWPTWIGILWKWANLLTKLAGDCECRLALFNAIRNFLINEIYHFFKAVPPNRLPFYLGSLLHVISSLFTHMRSPWKFWNSQFDRRSKTWFFNSFIVYVFWIEQDKILISQLSPLKFRCFADQNGPKGDPMKMNFDNFQMQKWGPSTVRARKADEKNEVVSLVFIFRFWVMVLKLSKIVSFLQFLTDVSKKFKAAIAIYVYASESFRFALLKMVLVIMLWLRV